MYSVKEMLENQVYDLGHCTCTCMYRIIVLIIVLSI